jgi:hypothetical protein
MVPFFLNGHVGHWGIKPNILQGSRHGSRD